MKKLLNTGFFYALLSMASGIFFREFTRMQDYTGKTALSSTHLHLFALGAMVFLMLVLFEKQFSITEQKKFPLFYGLYNIGLLSMVGGFFYRGIDQVLGWNGGAMISGIAGMTHIIFGIGVVYLFLLLKDSVCPKKITS